MNISDVERLTGLSRANVRFYEKQGLLSPDRQENGYRDYTRDHVDVLRKIRLLREVGVPLDQIRAVMDHPESFQDLLGNHISVIGREIHRQQSALSVCTEMRDAHVDFVHLDAEKYLNRMADLQRQGMKPPVKKVNVLVRDVDPFVPHPWRRVLARQLDLLLYGAALALLLRGVLGIFLDGWMALIQHFLILGMMAAVEPLLLHTFGTTVGKWIFGIRITDDNGAKLSYKAGFERTRQVILLGMGLNLPIICWVCMHFARKRYVESGCTSWDYDCDYQVLVRKKSIFWLSWAVGIGVLALCQGMTQWADVLAYLPPHQGHITLEQFAENYNHTVTMDTRMQGNTDAPGLIGDLLDSGGDYRDHVLNENGAVVVEIVENAPLQLVYELKDGFVQAVSFEAQLTVDGFFDGYQDEMRRILFALGDLSAWDTSVRRMNSMTKELAFMDYEWQTQGVHVMCDVTMDEDAWIRFSTDALRAPKENAASFSLSFRAEKINSK